MPDFLNYSTKRACKEAIQAILHKPLYKCGAPLKQADMDTVHELLKLHPEYHKKVGCGIAAIVVDDPPSCYPNHSAAQGFWIVRTDGSKEDISYLKCLQSKAPEHMASNHKQALDKGFRGIISKSIIAWKRCMLEGENTFICGVCKEKHPSSNSHADHYPYSFQRILGDFKECEKLKDEELETVDRGGYLGLQYKDAEINDDEDCGWKALERHWKLFHNNWYADEDYYSEEGDDPGLFPLRLLCSRCNLTRPKETR